MHEVAKLITTDPEKKIVVLSALSGTTNALVEIGQSAAHFDREKAGEQISKLSNHYHGFIEQLLQTEKARAQALAIIGEHFEFLSIILRISFSEALNKDILAQGELLSTKLFSVYLEEKGISHVLLPALEFMRIDTEDEPQLS
jgi:aspartate kinase